MTVFGKILSGEIPSERLHEDELCIAIRDIAPQAPVHILIIPKEPVEKIHDLKETSLVGHMVGVAQKVAESEGISEGYRLVINNGAPAGQTVFHLHMHLIGGAQLSERMA